MTRSEVRARVVYILVENLDSIDETEATDEAELKLNLGADDLDITGIALAIEEEFDFEMFDDEQIRERTTVGELVDLIVDQLESGGAR